MTCSRHRQAAELLEVLRQPRGTHLAAVQAQRAAWPPPAEVEAWNTEFGARSLYDAWSRSPLAAPIYEANAATLRSEVLHRPHWVVIDVGVGNGRLWREALRPDDRGTVVMIDPVRGAIEHASSAMPEGVHVVAMPCAVEVAALPHADAVVCSLMLHHIAGHDAAHRQAHGLSGPGKVEVLEAFAEALRRQQGLLILNEADVHCEIDLPPGEPILSERLLDSYVRRCARGLAEAVLAADPDDDVAARWWAIARRWCLDQLDHAGLPLPERDVYELDVERWLALLARAGLSVHDHGFTDPHHLFHRYLARPR